MRDAPWWGAIGLRLRAVAQNALFHLRRSTTLRRGAQILGIFLT